MNKTVAIIINTTVFMCHVLHGRDREPARSPCVEAGRCPRKGVDVVIPLIIGLYDGSEAGTLVALRQSTPCQL